MGGPCVCAFVGGLAELCLWVTGNAEADMCGACEQESESVAFAVSTFGCRVHENDAWWGEEVQEQASRKGGSTVASKMMLFIREGLLELSTDQGVLPECTYFTGKPPDIIEDLLYDLQTEFPEVFFCVCVRTCVCVCVRMCVCVFACVRGRVRG